MDTVGDLMSIIGFPEDTECTFIYDGCLLDVTGVIDAANKDTRLYNILKTRTGGGNWVLLSSGEGKELVKINNTIHDLEKKKIEQEKLLEMEEQENAKTMEELRGEEITEEEEKELEEVLSIQMRKHLQLHLKEKVLEEALQETDWVLQIQVLL